MYIPQEAVEEIRLLGEKAFPEEACGVLVLPPQGRHYVRPLVNTAEVPTKGYAIDNTNLVESLVDLMEAEEIVVTKHEVVVWHTHPSGHVGPSRDDLRYKEPDLQYLVVALPTGEATLF